MTSADRRPSAAWLGLVSIEAVAVAVLAVAGTAGGSGERDAARETRRELAHRLTLTDLALWSEAGYCRHPSQADRFSPWATHPAAIEHFPAGSFVAPGAGLRR